MEITFSKIVISFLKDSHFFLTNSYIPSYHKLQQISQPFIPEKTKG